MQTKENVVSMRTVMEKTKQELDEKRSIQRRVCTRESFVWDKWQAKFWDLEDLTLNPAEVVDCSIPQREWRREDRNGREILIKPSKDIQRIELDQTVENSTWFPVKERILKNMMVNASGMFPSKGRMLFNKYKEPPDYTKGDPDQAQIWIDHVRNLWSKEADYFFDYCAHMLQKPEEKCNTAIVLSGKQGIGKDAALNPVKDAIGVWNCKNISPDKLFDQFKSYIQTLMLVIDEVRSTEDHNATAFYNILKPLVAAPPDILEMNEKFLNPTYVPNVMRVFITTNDYSSMYIPKEDRRMFIMHSKADREWAGKGYFDKYHAWYRERKKQGCLDVAAWLMQRDISKFKAKVEAPKTEGWKVITDSWMEPEDAVTQALDILNHPDVVFPSEMIGVLMDNAGEIREMMRYSMKKMRHRMEKAGYVMYAPFDGKKKFFYKGSKTIQDRVCFVKIDLQEDPQGLIDAHGRELSGMIKVERQITS